VAPQGSENAGHPGRHRDARHRIASPPAGAVVAQVQVGDDRRAHAHLVAVGNLHDLLENRFLVTGRADRAARAPGGMIAWNAHSDPARAPGG